MKKKTKFLVCALAALSTLSFVGCGGVKDWFDDKLNGKDDTACVHADVDYNNVCDHCGVATKFEEVEIVKGEQAMGNWYRIYNYNCVVNMAGGENGVIYFTDGLNSFAFSIDESCDYDSTIGLLVDADGDTVGELDSTGIFEFHSTEIDEHEACADEKSYYYDVYLEEGKTFTIQWYNSEDGSPLTLTFTIDENITVSACGVSEYNKRLKVVAA